MTKTDPHILKLMSVDGQVFYLRCRSTFDVLLDRSFLGFLTLSIALFIVINVLTSALHGGEGKTLQTPLDVLAVVLFFGMIMFMVLSLTLILGTVFFRLAKWGLMKTIYIPLFYIVPVLFFHLGTWLLGSHVVIPEMFALTVMFLIICACFDALYGNFAAPYHSKYIRVGDLAAPSEKPVESPDISMSTKEKPASPSAQPDQQTPKAKPATLPAEPLTAETKEPRPLETSETRSKIYIRKQAFSRDDIRWIQSEDHYLKIHLLSESVLLLGKLTDAVAQLPEELGVQINRSMWVARSAIQSIEEQNSRNVFVILTTGEKLKVTKLGRKILEKIETERARP